MNTMINPETLDLRLLPWLPLSSRKDLPEIPCIYFAIDSLGTAQYIGMSLNLRQRWIDHHQYKRLSTIDNIRIAYFSVDATELLPQIEAVLIERFQPQLNLISSGQGMKSFTSERIVNVPELSKKLQELWVSGGKKGFNRFSVAKVARHLNLTEHYWKKLLNGETGNNISVDLLRKIESFFRVSFGVSFND